MLKLARADRRLAYALAGLAGLVDACGFLAADRFFVSFMSGNTTRLGVELARGTQAALVAAGLIAGFVAGVAAGAIVAERSAAHRRAAVLGLVALLLTLAAAGLTLGSGAAYLAGAVLAMGAVNNVLRRDGEVAIGVTYMTGALVRLGEGLAGWIDGSGRGRRGALPSLLLWTSLAAGAATGTLLTGFSAVLAAWVAPALAAALMLATLRRQ